MPSTRQLAEQTVKERTSLTDTAIGNVNPVSAAEFRLYQSYVESRAGISLPPTKKELLFGRLAPRLRQLGVRSFRAYLQRVREDEQEAVEMLDRITTNETHFFREIQHFEFLEQWVLPQWRAPNSPQARRGRVRVWSAGCSRGEEPYSIAMVLLQQLPAAEGWHIEIVATDLSNRTLNFAQQAVWPIEKAAEIPRPYLKRFMLKGRGLQKGKMTAGEDIRSVVSFQRLNLNEAVYPLSGCFDLIFCRNVLIYFTPETKRRVVERLLNHLAPDGYLFVGHAETLTGVTERVRPIMPTTYVPCSAGNDVVPWRAALAASSPPSLAASAHGGRL